jgi:GTP-binding protein HflX
MQSNILIMESTIKAVLVGIQLPKVSKDEHEASLKELGRLVTTLGYKVIGQMSQKKSSEKSPTYLGEGKLKTLALWTGGSGVVASLVKRKISKAKLKFLADETAGEADSAVDEETEATDSEQELNDDEVIEVPSEKADLVVVDSDLSPSQLRNMESAAGVMVLDRTGVIIEIFGRHARTRSARLQVEIAKLIYMAPRLRETGQEKQMGGGGVGSGETKLELDRRHVRDRIKELKTELASVENEHLIRRSRRAQENSVALVGYTNAGKSSLMRAMTSSEVLVADKLFATLDTTIRPLFPETHPKILFSDTVGFIKKLPHDLVASFKSTLDEANHASLLLYVVDASDPTFRAQLEVTKSVLSEVGAGEHPSWLVLNKKDLLSNDEVERLKAEYPDALFISTKSKQDLKDLREKLINHFETGMIEEDILVPYKAKGAIGEIRARMRVMQESHNEHGTLFRVRASLEDLKYLETKFSIQLKART